MTALTLQVTDDVCEKLQSRASKEGCDMATVAVKILEQELHQSQVHLKPSELPYEEWYRRYKAMIAGHPRIDVEVDDSRETIYQGRGE